MNAQELKRQHDKAYLAHVDVIRKRVAAYNGAGRGSGLTSIAAGTGISLSALSRFAAGKIDMTPKRVDVVHAYLDGVK